MAANTVMQILGITLKCWFLFTRLTPASLFNFILGGTSTETPHQFAYSANATYSANPRECDRAEHKGFIQRCDSWLKIDTSSAERVQENGIRNCKRKRKTKNNSRQNWKECVDICVWTKERKKPLNDWTAEFHDNVTSNSQKWKCSKSWLERGQVLNHSYIILYVHIHTHTHIYLICRKYRTSHTHIHSWIGLCGEHEVWPRCHSADSGIRSISGKLVC